MSPSPEATLSGASTDACTVSLSAAAGAATVGTVLAVALGGASPAYAGWSATPAQSPVPSTAAPDCLSTLANASSEPSATGSDTSTGKWQTLLTDVRGPFTLQVYANDTTSATCINGPGISAVRVSQSSQAETVPAGEIQISPGPRGAPGRQVGPDAEDARHRHHEPELQADRREVEPIRSNLEARGFRVVAEREPNLAAAGIHDLYARR